MVAARLFKALRGCPCGTGPEYPEAIFFLEKMADEIFNQ